MLEMRLLQSEKLEALGRLAGGVAHDFNNMLTVIIGACHILDLNIDDRKLEVDNIVAIREAAMRAAGLTKQLLAFSRQQPSQPQQLNLNAVITQNEVILARLGGPGLQLQINLADDLKLVNIDPSQVEQVLVNLIINSRDAFSDQGLVEINTHNVTRCQTIDLLGRAADCREYVQLTVSDNGCGMVPEVLAHIFDPFYTTKPVGKGTGLGLAVVHGIVTQNGGIIEVDSQPQIGTTFRILFPAIEATSGSTTYSAKGGPLEGGTESVLVVDDEIAIGNMTAKTLRSLGYKVFTASTPEQALEVFQANRLNIDILLTDLLMLVAMACSCLPRFYRKSQVCMWSS